MACTSILKLISDIPPWHRNGSDLTQGKELNWSIIIFLVSCPLERVELLAACDYKAQKVFCILYIQVSI